MADDQNIKNNRNIAIILVKYNLISIVRKITIVVSQKSIIQRCAAKLFSFMQLYSSIDRKQKNN